MKTITTLLFAAITACAAAAHADDSMKKDPVDKGGMKGDMMQKGDMKKDPPAMKDPMKAGADGMKHDMSKDAMGSDAMKK